MHTDKRYMDLKENVQWFSIFLLLLLSLMHSSYIFLCLLWTIEIIVIGNVKRIHSQKFKKTTLLIRRCLYIIPLLFPLIIKNEPPLKSFFLIEWTIFAIILGLLCLLPKYKEWRILLSNEYIQMSKAKSNSHLISIITLLVCAPIAEEYFFRFFIISINDFTIINYIISCFLFFLSHYGVKWSQKFNKYDFLLQIIFSVLSGLLYILSNSIVPSIIFHLIYNTPRIIYNLKLIRYSYKNVLRREAT